MRKTALAALTCAFVALGTGAAYADSGAGGNGGNGGAGGAAGGIGATAGNGGNGGAGGDGGSGTVGVGLGLGGISLGSGGSGGNGGAGGDGGSGGVGGVAGNGGNGGVGGNGGSGGSGGIGACIGLCGGTTVGAGGNGGNGGAGGAGGVGGVAGNGGNGGAGGAGGSAGGGVVGVPVLPGGVGGVGGCGAGQHFDHDGDRCIPNGVGLGGPQLFCQIGFHRVGGVCVPNDPGIGLWGPGHWGGHFGGHVIVLDGGPTLDVCSAPSYTVFIDRWGVYRTRINGLLGADPAARWFALHGACGVPDPVTVVGATGTCSTVTTYYNDYLGAVRRWNGLALRYHGFFSPTQRLELDGAWRDQLRWRGEFLRLRPTVTTTCGCPTTINNIVVDPHPVAYVPPASYVTPSTPAPAAPVSTPVAPADPGSSNPSAIPSGSVNTGGWDSASSVRG